MGAKGKGIDTNILVFQSSEPEDTVHGGWNKNQWCWNIIVTKVPIEELKVIVQKQKGWKLGSKMAK